MSGMKRHLTIGILCLTAALAGADELIDARGLPYQGAILGYQNRTIRLRSTTLGREKTCPLDQIRSLKIDGLDALNQAEALAAKKKYPQAVEAYDKALQSAPTDRAWLASLLADRRYQALARAGKIDKALQEWLAMAAEAPDDKIIQAIMPQTFAPQGDPANAQAVKLLDAEVARLGKNAKTREHVKRLLTLKMKLLEAMGESENAAVVARDITQLDAPPAEAGREGTQDDEAEPAPAPPPAATGDLAVLGQLVKAGQYDEVIRKLAPRMETLPRNDLAAPLFLLAKAQWLKYQADEPKDPKLLLRAGLNLMWVYSAYGDSDEAPEALFLTAEMHRALKDPVAEQSALEELIEQFGGAGDNPWVEKARGLLESKSENEEEE
ncbi:MAG: hypothetical protein JW849_00985 [Phycisphaerae bacterium]|nr:hypothetical protein [Phycisphaerae bacterium]